MILSEFRALHPEFVNATDVQITQFLIDAEAQTDPAFWGDSQDVGVRLLVAHWLSLAPAGKHARLQSDSAETTYGRERSRLIQETLPARGLLL